MALNWNDPVLLIKQYRALPPHLLRSSMLTKRAVDFIKLQHALGGVYIWELVIGLWYDYRLLQRRQRHASSTWAKWVR